MLLLGTGDGEGGVGCQCVPGLDLGGGGGLDPETIYLARSRAGERTSPVLTRAVQGLASLALREILCFRKEREREKKKLI